MSARRALPAAPGRRGWCPGLDRPMPTGDGLLARIHPPLGILSPAQLRAVAEAASRYGNGHVDITARANLQIRGVREATRGPLAAALTEAGLGDVRHDGGPQRLTLTSPLCGLDPDALVDGLALAARIEVLGRAVAPLPAKTLVAVEPGGLCGLPEAEADFHVRAVAPGLAEIALATGAAPLSLGVWPEAAVPETVAALLAAFARTGARRMRDLSDDQRAALPPFSAEESGPRVSEGRLGRNHAVRGSQRQVGARPSCGAEPFPAPSHPSPPPLRGVPSPAKGGGRTAVIAADAPFGRSTADALLRLVAVADEAGAADIRLTPSRGFVLAVDPARADEALARLAADFITDAHDPRRAVAACPGAPACASGSTDTHADAARLAEAFRPFAARGLSAHVSGCPKGCAEPRPRDLTLVGEAGRYGVVVGGAPGDAPAEWLTIEAALDRVRGAQTANLEDLFRTRP
ncbi:precorrin-3B synthase [Methylobacterium radiodurans]|uniref:Precorrin-3B synthase n=1 Tax=Methylobacterium radiodurans TaxID=2202828 RepID=A0A2U8VVM2_9HYPH|nr:precorrin-3B synthase [Methylobacterium radiodurans]AWN37884.1 precorrin-3B synthase [Methylobacterium radiodurans]